ncbi:MAG: hypothetical protein NTZ46_07360 [Verrucomicrobia bacterium]|nr:hypothetical protein [Verrucomicrobiota bacterium]
MKLSFFVSCLLALVLAAAPVFAQPETSTPAPQGMLVVPSDPAKQVGDFFRILIEGRVDAAYDQLLKGTKIFEMPKDVATLKAKTREALRVFGDIGGYELVDTKEVGHHLIRVTCLSLSKNLPIRWRFYFYKVSESWKLIDIRIDDRLLDLFEEPAPAAAPVK